MLPRWLLPVLALLVLAPAARATWIESGDVEIAISTPGTVLVEASEVEPGDVMAYVEVGGPSTTGEVTVVGEGDITTPKRLGNWRIEQGTGNIQTVIGVVNGGANIGSSAAPDATTGALNILNSDLGDLSSFKVYQGNLNVTASRIGFVEVFEEAAFNAQLGSRIASLFTQEDSFTSIKESLLSSNGTCQLWSTVIIEDSIVRCRSIEIDNPGDDSSDVDLRAFVLPYFELETTQAFEVNGGTVDIANAVAETGELLVGSADTYVGIAASTWTNAGGTQIEASGTVAPVEVAIGAGTRFHELGDVRVTGQPGWQHLTVNGAGTELEIDGDLRVGEYLDFRNRPQTFTGNMTVSNGAVVIVDGTLVVRSQGVLTIESGATVYAAATDIDGAVNENGGALVLPEPGATLGGVVSLAALALAGGRLRRPHLPARCARYGGVEN